MDSSYIVCVGSDPINSQLRSKSTPPPTVTCETLFDVSLNAGLVRQGVPKVTLEELAGATLDPRKPYFGALDGRIFVLLGGADGVDGAAVVLAESPSFVRVRWEVAFGSPRFKAIDVFLPSNQTLGRIAAIKDADLLTVTLRDGTVFRSGDAEHPFSRRRR